MTYSEMAAELADVRRDAPDNLAKALTVAIGALELAVVLTSPPPPVQDDDA